MGPPGWIPAAVKNQCGKSSGLVIAYSTTDPALSAGSFQVALTAHRKIRRISASKLRCMDRNDMD